MGHSLHVVSCVEVSHFFQVLAPSSEHQPGSEAMEAAIKLARQVRFLLPDSNILEFSPAI
jgi:acetylornithine/succinyldiaminopimelate/putrescine aminotransferase